MSNGQQKRFDFTPVIIGLAGLLVVGWGIWEGYLSRYFVGTVSQHAVVVQADYSAVGEASGTKTVAEAPSVSGSQSNTASSSKSDTASENLPPSLPYTATPFAGSAWIYDWGLASIASSTLNFGAAATSAGGDLFLASSSAWTNYVVEANVNWLAGQSFGIIARLADTEDFVYCDFGDKTAQIVLRANGNDTMISQSATVNDGAGTIQNLGVSVSGNDVGCMVNNTEVLGATIPQGEPLHGGIGLISWDATPGVSRIAINNLEATALPTNNITVPFPVAPTVATVTTVATSSNASVVSVATSTAAAVPVKKLEIPYSENNFTIDTNWQKTWGVMATDTSNFMDIESAADTSGGSAVLNNTDNWINYRVSATLDWLKGETFMIIGRYADSGDYVACNLVRDPNSTGAIMIELEKFVNGNETTLQTGEDNNFPHEGNANIAVSLSLQDTQATCSFDGHVVSNAVSGSYGVSPIPGTVGFSTWDPTLGNTEIVVKQVSVTSNY